MSLTEEDRRRDEALALVSTLDSLVEARVLVIGRLPPEGRDFDLFARPPEVDALSRGLGAAGFVGHGGAWLRFRACSVDKVEIIPSPRWFLPPEELDPLFRDALPIEGASKLVRVAPHHLLLILARLTVQVGAHTQKRRAKVDAALEEDPGAWGRARHHAAGWRATKALDCLSDAHRTGAPPTTAAVVDALAEWGVPLGKLWALRARVSARRAVLRRRMRRRPPGGVVSFSGLDGAGKSSQVQGLIRLLSALGFQAERQYVRFEWTTLHDNKVLEAITWPLRTAMRLRQRRAGGDPSPSTSLPPATAGVTGLRERSSFLTDVWVTIVALLHVRTQRRLARRHVKAGRIAIFDRYTLDAAAAIIDRYGEPGRFRFQIAMIHRLSVRPIRAYFLDVEPETSLARAVEDFTFEQLARRASLYRSEWRRLGLAKLDGERPPDELCAEIGMDVWAAIRSRSR